MPIPPHDTRGRNDRDRQEHARHSEEFPTDEDAKDGSQWMQFQATAGAVIRVWMYSPPTPGYVVIDDVSLTTP